MDMTAFQGMLPSGQSLLAPQQQPYPQASLLANPQATQPGITGIMGPYSQLAYQMAGSPKQGGAYASVAPPPGVPGSSGSSGSAVGSTLGGTALGILGALTKSPQLTNALGSGVKSLTNSIFGTSAPAAAGASSGATAYGTDSPLSGLAQGVSPLLNDDLAATTGIAGAGLQSVGVGAAQQAADSSAAEAAQALGGSGSGGIFGSGFTGSQALGAAAVPLALYNEINNWQSGATGSDALAGAGTGAAIGSVVPVIGTALGALIGGAGGALSSLFGPGKTDPETQGVQKLINAVGANPGQASAITSSVQNPYLGLAGLFDERSSTLPMYAKYGRMGEQKFTNDLASQLNGALKSGAITQSTSPTDAYNKVIAPWVASMGNGWNNVGQTYQQTTQGLLQQMTAQYMNGTANSQWKAIGGDSPFANLTAFGG